jgi:hypothetical protein
MRAFDYLTSTPVAIPEGLQEPPVGMRRSSGSGGGGTDSVRAVDGFCQVAQAPRKLILRPEESLKGEAVILAPLLTFDLI